MWEIDLFILWKQNNSQIHVEYANRILEINYSALRDIFSVLF